MKSILHIFALLLISVRVFSQNFDIYTETFTLNGMPGIQSYVSAKRAPYWVLIGGRTDGLHKRQPNQSFLAASNNTNIYVVNPHTQQVWSASITTLPTALREQLQSTNMVFEQLENKLYVAGGYGYSATAQDHITYPHLTVIDLDGLINAIIQGSPIASYFRQITNNNLAITGGYMGYMDSTFYIVGGQKFTGRYNPMNGPSFTQEYSNQIRTFKLTDDGTNLQLTNYNAVTDAVNLHRRDYNMAEQIFPDGTFGYTAFSGVFQYTADLPYLNSVDVKPSGYTVNNTFNQYLNHYHGAHAGIYDAADNQMHTVFFGGISQYYYDANDSLIQDDNVPFVNTISMVTRRADGSMQEYKMPNNMPGLYGAGAEFIVADSIPLSAGKIINYNQLGNDTTLIGYVVGGINSTGANVFFSNDANPSSASTIIHKVYLVKQQITALTPNNRNRVTAVKLFPNPASDKVTIQFEVNTQAVGYVLLQNIAGQVLEKYRIGDLQAGKYETEIDVKGLQNGTYFVTVQCGAYNQNAQLIINR